MKSTSKTAQLIFDKLQNSNKDKGFYSNDKSNIIITKIANEIQQEVLVYKKSPIKLKLSNLFKLIDINIHSLIYKEISLLKKYSEQCSLYLSYRDQKKEIDIECEIKELVDCFTVNTEIILFKERKVLHPMISKLNHTNVLHFENIKLYFFSKKLKTQQKHSLDLLERLKLLQKTRGLNKVKIDFTDFYSSIEKCIVIFKQWMYVNNYLIVPQFSKEN